MAKHQPATSGETVTVGCKLPNGMILRVFDMIEGSEPVLGGGSRTMKVAQQRGEPVTIHGNRVPHGEAPKCQIIGGFALTPGVSKEFFELWQEQNADSDIVKNNLIFGYETLDESSGVAEENAARSSGLQPLNPGNDPRIPKRIQTADEQPKAAL